MDHGGVSRRTIVRTTLTLNFSVGACITDGGGKDRCVYTCLEILKPPSKRNSLYLDG
jgi:hypothetical protein